MELMWESNSRGAALLSINHRPGSAEFTGGTLECGAGPSRQSGQPQLCQAGSASHILSTLVKCTIAIVLVPVIVGLAACKPLATPTSNASAQNSPGLRSLQKAKYLKASLYGVTAMEFNQVETVTYPLRLGVPSAPITWMGTIFDSKLENVGPGGEMTIRVHGNVSEDGAWIENLSYSEQVISTGARTTVFYHVVLRTVPITPPKAGETSIAGTFTKTGADVQKHVERMEYSQFGGAIPLQYTSIDWNTEVDNQKPVLKVAFEVVPSEDIGAVGSGDGM